MMFIRGTQRLSLWDSSVCAGLTHISWPMSTDWWVLLYASCRANQILLAGEWPVKYPACLLKRWVIPHNPPGSDWDHVLLTMGQRQTNSFFWLRSLPDWELSPSGGHPCPFSPRARGVLFVLKGPYDLRVPPIVKFSQDLTKIILSKSTVKTL